MSIRTHTLFPFSARFRSFRTAGAWPTPSRVGAAWGLAAVCGAAIHLVIMRRLRLATATARVIATLGVLTALQGLVVKLRGSNLQLVRGVIPDRAVEVFGITIGRDRLILAGIATLLALALAAVSRWTRFGLATQAVAENAQSAAALGWSPDLVATGTWAAVSALAALAATLIAPVVGLSMVELSLLIVPADRKSTRLNSSH